MVTFIFLLFERMQFLVTIFNIKNVSVVFVKYIFYIVPHNIMFCVKVDWGGRQSVKKDWIRRKQGNNCINLPVFLVNFD